MKRVFYTCLLALILLFSFSKSNAQSNIIGNPIRIENIEVAQFEFPNRMNWNDASLACSALGDGWRLPTETELIFLLKNRYKISNFNTQGFHWTSKVDRDSKLAVAGGLLADDEQFNLVEKSDLEIVRAVRNSINNSAPGFYVGEDQKKRNNLSVLRFTSYDCGELVKSINSKGKNPRYNNQPKLYADEVVGPAIGEYIVQHYSNATESEFKSLINQASECVSISLNNVKPNTNNSAVQNCNINFQIPTLPFQYIDNRVLCIYCKEKYIPFRKIDINDTKKNRTVSYVVKQIDKHCENVGADNSHKASHLEKFINLLVNKGYYNSLNDAFLAVGMREGPGNLMSNYTKSIGNLFSSLLGGGAVEENKDNEFTIKLYENNNTKFCTREHEDRYNRRY